MVYHLKWTNKKDFRKHIETLNKEYGKGNVPIEKAMDFNFKIACKRPYWLFNYYSKLLKRKAESQ